MLDYATSDRERGSLLTVIAATCGVTAGAFGAVMLSYGVTILFFWCIGNSAVDIQHIFIAVGCVVIGAISIISWLLVGRSARTKTSRKHKE